MLKCAALQKKKLSDGPKSGKIEIIQNKSIIIRYSLLNLFEEYAFKTGTTTAVLTYH